MGQGLSGTCESHSCGERWTCRQARWAQETLWCPKEQNLSHLVLPELPGDFHLQAVSRGFSVPCP